MQYKCSLNLPDEISAPVTEYAKFHDIDADIVIMYILTRAFRSRKERETFIAEAKDMTLLDALAHTTRRVLAQDWKFQHHMLTQNMYSALPEA